MKDRLRKQLFKAALAWARLKHGFSDPRERAQAALSMYFRVPGRLRGRYDATTASLQILAALLPDVSFVQIGSNDGVTEDPLHPFIVPYGWSGILVEPVPYIFERLVQNYAACDGLRFVNAAISADKKTMFRLPSSNGATSTWQERLATFHPEILKNHGRLHDHFKDVESRLIEEPVRCLTFESLLTECNSDGAVDLVHVDAEGHDYEILKMLIASTVRPLLIIYEHRHLSSSDNLACKADLKRAGYRTIQGPQRDTLSVLSLRRRSKNRP